MQVKLRVGGDLARQEKFPVLHFDRLGSAQCGAIPFFYGIAVKRFGVGGKVAEEQAVGGRYFGAGSQQLGIRKSLLAGKPQAAKQDAKYNYLFHGVKIVWPISRGNTAFGVFT